MQYQREKHKKRTSLEEIAIYNLDLDCYHAKDNLIMTRSWWKMIKNPTFNYKKSLINKVMHQLEAVHKQPMIMGVEAINVRHKGNVDAMKKD